MGHGATNNSHIQNAVNEVNQIVDGINNSASNNEPEPASPTPEPVVVSEPVVESEAVVVSEPSVTPVTSTGPRKRALLIGLNYQGTSATLTGCERDVENMRDLLISRFDYSSKDIELVFYKDLKSMGILDRLKKLASETVEGDEVFFHYSGHGSKITDYSNDEADGMDEVLIGYRLRRVKDDDIYKVIKSMPDNIVMTLIIDACNSGSMIDLKYQYNGSGNIVVTSKRESLKGKTIVSLSGCRDDQTSAESGTPGKVEGVLSRTLKRIADDEPIESYTWKQLTGRIRTSIKKERFSQIPQLSSNDPDIFGFTVGKFLS